MDAHAEFGGALDDRLGRYIGLTGVDIEHVIGRRATGEQHFRHGDLRAELDGFEIHALPDFVKAHQPVKQLGVLNRFQTAREGLIQMMVSVD